MSKVAGAPRSARRADSCKAAVSVAGPRNMELPRRACSKQRWSPPTAGCWWRTAASTRIIIAANAPGSPGVPGHEPDTAEGEAARARVAAGMKVIRDATPGAGSYVNETDYFEPNWQQEFWGENYERLSRIKRKYDPEDLFFCHHCVGSERWSTDGSCKSAP